MVKKAFLILIPVILYSAILFVVLFSVLFLDSQHLLFGDDIHRNYYFYRTFVNQSLSEGRLPLWNPYIFSGVPFIGNAIVNFWYPLTWLYVFLPLRLAFSWHVYAHILWAMCGMYVLLRSKMASVPAFIGGIFFGLSGFFMSRIWAGHMDVIAAASYIPWSFTAFDALMRADRKHVRSSLVIASVAFAAQLFAGYQTMAFFTVEALGIYIVCTSISLKSLRPFLLCGMAGLLAMGASSIQTYPVQEFFRQGIRTFQFPYEWITYGSMTLESLWQLYDPFHFGDQHTYAGPPPNYHEHAAYFGKVGLFFFCMSLLWLVVQTVRRNLGIKDHVNHREKGNVVFFGSMVAVAFFTIWISLGSNAIVDLQKILWQIVPMYHYLRFPPRHMVLFVFSGSVLAAYGVSLLKYFKIQLVVLVLILYELIPYGRHFIASQLVPEDRHDPYLVSQLQPKNDELFRYLPNFGVWLEPRNSMDPDAAMMYGHFDSTGYDPSILKSYYQFVDASLGNATPSILQHDVQVPYMNLGSSSVDFLNIKYVLLPTFADTLHGVVSKYRLVKEDLERQYRLYENTQVLPRFYFVDQARYFSTSEAVYAEIASGFSKYAHEVLIEGAVELVKPCTTISPGSVSIISYTNNEIVLQTSRECPGYLVSSEVYYPGWSARIDGVPTNIYKSNLSFRSVLLPQGTHRVVFSYQPISVWIGAAVTGITILLLYYLWKHPENTGLL